MLIRELQEYSKEKKFCDSAVKILTAREGRKMKIGKNGIEYTIDEHRKISNEGEKILKSYRSKGKCMYGKCGNNAIFSHVISERGSLSSIANHGKVGYFESRREDLNRELNFKKNHINRVAGFKGFCSVHDNQLFECIDNNSDVKTGSEILLQSYRSVCKALHEEGCYPFLELSKELDFDMLKQYLQYDNAFANMDIDAHETEIMKEMHLMFEEQKNKLFSWRRMLSDYKESIENDIENEFSAIHIDKTGNMLKVTTSDEKVAVLYQWFDWKIPVGLFNHHRFKGNKSVDCILNFTYIPYKESAEAYWILLNKDLDYFEEYWKWFISEKINVLNTIESSMMALENWCIDPYVIDAMDEERRNIFIKDMYFNTERADIRKEYDISIFDDIRRRLIREGKCNIQKETDKFQVPLRDSEELRKNKYEQYVIDNVM